MMSSLSTTTMVLPVLLLLILLISTVSADMYLMSPRGSNNRLDEANRDRNNGNRMFDSQNNNRGGSNVGEIGRPYYYTGSELSVEWTSQHSCGNPNNNCEVIYQYKCDPRMRDGTTTDTIPDEPASRYDAKFGMHESYDWYQSCKRRQRNKGLFLSNQRLARNNRNNADGAIYTRQNPDGNRRGFECPEERDYYPYWAPTPWRDAFILTNNPLRCAALQDESQNVKSRFMCVIEPIELQEYVKENPDAQGYIPITQLQCETVNGPGSQEFLHGVWTEVPAWNITKPACVQSPMSRDNHLGNVAQWGYTADYNWTIPDDYFTQQQNDNIPLISEVTQALMEAEYGQNVLTTEHCVVRIRYNISTGE
jgi:hypothetical protein